MDLAILMFAVPAIAAIVLLARLLSVQKLSNEPPYIPSLVPYVGHMIGILRHRNLYYLKVNSRYQLPIYSLAMPAGKVYVVNSPDLALAVQRHPKALSFWYIEVVFGVRMSALNEQTSAALMHNLHGEKGDKSLFHEGNSFLLKILKPGEGLNGMNRAAFRSLTTSFAEKKVDSKEQVDLWEWVRHVMTMATTDSTYGPMNPYNDPEVENAFWQMADEAPLLLAGFMPHIIARKGYKGREKLVAAFEQYFEAGGYKEGSLMTQGRYDVTNRYGITLKEMARFEAVQGITILSNTVPAGFWTLFHVFSKPPILELVRAIAWNLLRVEKRDDKVLRILNVTKIREIPLLASIFNESLRHQGHGSGARFVMEDIMLDDRYLLKKGTFLIMPNDAMHFDASAWGSNVNGFDAERFTKKVHPGAFRAFGGGANLCPGRFFAMTEILAMVVMCVLRYDITPVGGEWNLPLPDYSIMSAIVTPPKDKIPVEITERKGWEGGEWAFET